MDYLIKFIRTIKRNNLHKYGLLLLILIYDSYLECVKNTGGYICTISLLFFILSLVGTIIVSKIKKVKYSLNGMLFVSSITSVFLTIFVVSIISIFSFTLVYHSTLSFKFIYLFFLYFLLSHVLWKYLFIKNMFGWTIYLRIIILIIGTALLIIYLICYYFFIIEIGCVKPKSLHDFARLFCAFFFILILTDFLMSLWKNVHYSFVRKKVESKKYILFLRCFKFDSVNLYTNVLTDLSAIFKKEYNVLQIGNPRNILKGYSMCDTFYLPSTNWQPVVRDYIINADIVFLVLDQTNGILWEMLQHTEHSKKYVYYIPMNTNLAKLISNELFLDEYKNGNPIATLIKVWQNELTEGSFFYFYDGTLHLFSDIFSLVIEYAQLYNLHSKETIRSKCIKFKNEPPYHIEQTDWFSMIVNGDLSSIYNHIEKRFLLI